MSNVCQAARSPTPRRRTAAIKTSDFIFIRSPPICAWTISPGCEKHVTTNHVTAGPVADRTIGKFGLGLMLTALLLAGCTSDWTRQRERSDEVYLTVPRAGYRTDIVAFMRTYLNDPRGVRDAFVSEPMKRTLEGIDRYVACLRYNPRRSNGQYAGVRDSVVLFAEGRFDRVVENPENRPERFNTKEYCKDATYQPFPELERMR